jgi:acylphosphatase
MKESAQESFAESNACVEHPQAKRCNSFLETSSGDRHSWAGPNVGRFHSQSSRPSTAQRRDRAWSFWRNRLMAAAADAPGAKSRGPDAVVASSRVVAIGFEVFGKVQGVFFRKFTHSKAEALKLTGFVRNTDDGTVVGEARGPAASVEQFKLWLSTTGSPKSRIERCEVREITAPKDNYGGKFVIRR